MGAYLDWVELVDGVFQALREKCPNNKPRSCHP